MVMESHWLVDTLNSTEEWEFSRAAARRAQRGQFGGRICSMPERGSGLCRLVAKWHTERGITSAVDDMTSCPSYQRIIGMGPEVLPAIFAQLRQEGDDPDHWFLALEAITGANPVPESDFGTLGRWLMLGWLGRRIRMLIEAFRQKLPNLNAQNHEITSRSTRELQLHRMGGWRQITLVVARRRLLLACRCA